MKYAKKTPKEVTTVERKAFFYPVLLARTCALPIQANFSITSSFHSVGKAIARVFISFRLKDIKQISYLTKSEINESIIMLAIDF